jgi:integrase
MLRIISPDGAEPVVTWDDVRVLFERLYAPGIKPKKTRNKIRQALTQLERHAGTPDGVNEETIAAYVAASQARGNEPATTNSVLQAMQSITKYLRAKMIIAADPFALGLNFRRKERHVRRRDDKHLSIEQMRRVLDQADLEWNEARGLMPRFRAGRTMALVWLLSHTGLRATEALCLKRQRVADGFVEVRHDDQPEGFCKTEASERRVALPEEASQRLVTWMEFSAAFDGTWLFPCSRADRPWLHGMTAHRPLGRVAALAERAGIAGVTLLSFRHTFQTHAATRWGFSAKEIQEVVGHTNERTQLHYQHEDVDNLRALMRRVKYG